MTVKQDLQSLLHQVKHQEDCTATVLSLLKEVLAGNASKSQVGAFLFALGQLSPSAQLLAAVSSELSSHALPLPLVSCPEVIVDIVGTGGDGMNTFNVSTASGFIAAAAGCCVAKVSIAYIDMKAWESSFLFSVRLWRCIRSLGSGHCWHYSRHCSFFTSRSTFLLFICSQFSSCSTAFGSAKERSGNSYIVQHVRGSWFHLVVWDP
jgi:hypothetical protein